MLQCYNKLNVLKVKILYDGITAITYKQNIYRIEGYRGKTRKVTFSKMAILVSKMYIEVLYLLCGRTGEKKG